MRRTSWRSAPPPIQTSGGFAEGGLDRGGEIALSARDEGDLGLRQVDEAGEVGPAQVEDDQGTGRQRGQEDRPPALVVGRRVGLVPNLPRQPGADIKQGGHAPGQRLVRPVAQQADLAHQRVQGRAVHGQDVRVVGLGPGQLGRHGPAPRRPAGLHRGQHRQEHPLEQLGRQGPQALGERLLRDLYWGTPQEALLLEQAQQGGDRADLAPDHAQHQGDHHRQRQRPLAQAQGVEMGDLRQRRRMDQLGQPLGHHRVRWRDRRALAAVALDRPRVPNRAPFLGGWLGGWCLTHPPIVGHATRSGP
jgi:hypothetical protein